MKDDQDNLPSERSVWVASIISALELAATGTTWSPYPSEAAALLFEIERLRAQRMGEMDTASKRMAQAIGDLGETLTAKQRVEVVSRMEGFGFGRGHRH